MSKSRRKFSKTQSGGGKLLDTWTYEYKGVEDHNAADEDASAKLMVKNRKVSVELRLIKEFENAGHEPPLPVKDVHFQVVCPELKGVSFIGNDIEALRKAMWAALDKQYKIEWTDYYLVEIRPENPYSGFGTGFCLSYDTVEKGIGWDGSVLLKQRRWGERDPWITPWPGAFTDKNGRIQACIEANDFNKNALRECVVRIDTLREKLTELFKPENIEATLANLNACNWLPAPEVQEDEDEPQPITIESEADIIIDEGIYT